VAENHSNYHDLEDPDGLTEKEKAAMRWQAIQGFNAAPVAPLAARLGITQISRLNRFIPIFTLLFAAVRPEADFLNNQPIPK
jgi:hypothetical protein